MVQPNYQQGRVVDSKRAPFVPPVPSGNPSVGNRGNFPVEDEEDKVNPLEMPDLDVALPPLDVLGVDEQLCAVCEGSRKFETQKALAAYVRRSLSWLSAVRDKPAYQELVRRTTAAVAKRIVREAVDVEQMFNDQIRPSVETLVEIRDNPFNPAKVRVSASKELLDRAPEVPRKGDDMVDFVRKILIPVQHMKAISKALNEEGEGELLEMIESEEGTFKVDSGGNRVEEEGKANEAPAPKQIGIGRIEVFEM
jgi:hypothetical protein